MKKHILLISMNVLILTSVACLFCACPRIPNGQKTFTIVNKSDINIVFWESENNPVHYCSELGGVKVLDRIPADSLYVNEVDDWT